MGTTRVKVIDLSSDEKTIKTSRKHAEKLTSAAKLKKPEKKNGSTEEKQAKIKKAKVKAKTADTKTKPVEAEIKKDQKPQEKEEQSEEKIEEVKTAEVKPKKASTHHKGSKYLKAKKLVENKQYKTKEALDLLPKTSFTKFDPSVEIHLNVAEKNVKGAVKYPYSFATKQKSKKYLILGEKKDIKGDILWGDEKTINDIEEGTLKPGKDFDVVIAHPKFMSKLAKVAKILGPKGMMPNPKNGTITENPTGVISGGDKGEYQYKTDPSANIVHAKIGKLSQKPNELEENLKTLITAIGTSKIKKATLTSTMGPALTLDPTSL